MSPSDTQLPDTQGPALKRTLSLSLVTYYGIGNILGAVIYVLLGKVAGYAGSQTPISFLLASILAGFTALSYAELSARYPLSAGAVIYIQEGIGMRWLSLLVGILLVITGIVSAATIARGFVGYLDLFVQVPERAAIIVLLLCLGGLAAWGIGQSVLVAALMTLVEAGGLLFILWVLKPEAGALASTLNSLVLVPDAVTAQGIFLGAFLAFYAFIGFEDMANIAEEVRNPRRNMPLSIILALLISTLLYFAIALVAISAVKPAQLAGSDAPLAFLYQQATGSDPVLISAISLVAIINGALIQIIMASRICYGMGRKGWIPAWLAQVHPATRTPVVATALITLLVILMALWLPIEGLARATNFFILTVFTLVNISLWRVKHMTTSDYRGFTVCRWIPVAGALGSALFIALQSAASLY